MTTTNTTEPCFERQPFCDPDSGIDMETYVQPGAPFGDTTPWGKPQSAYTIAPGIWRIDTARHGGLWLSPDRLAAMPEILRLCSLSGDAWFEEDGAAAAVFMAFPGLMCIHNGLDGINDILPDEHRLRVCCSKDGYYLGRIEASGERVRDSVELWPKRGQAAAALEDGNWSIRPA